MDILEIIWSLLAFAGAIVAVLLIYKLIQFLFTNWYTSRILSVIAAIGALVKTILSKEDINEVDFLIIGVLSAASFYLWVNPYAFQIAYETAIIDFETRFLSPEKLSVISYFTALLSQPPALLTISCLTLQAECSRLLFPY